MNTNGETPWYRRPQRLLAIACALLGGLLIAFGPETRAAWLATATASQTNPEPLWDDVIPTPIPSPLVVYVSGAVVAPDVYRLPPGSRVIDALQAAGGLTELADIDGINLAALVQDSQHIRVPYAGERMALPAESDRSTDNGLINLNRATASDLEELPGVGKTLAERIIARRETQGPYRSVDELREVSGIGEKLFNQIAPLVTIGP
ncbi:helix-hairpin-helix domain-containing protein [Chloroflexus sp.]|uniref:helix-hairpin-helix domain-containing protein n=1 Tax=Chloroflexus sp. TaxID=1904827 RepID=UPI003D0B6B1C